MRKYAVILSLLAILIISGCQTLPPGDPPEGPIVTIDNDNNTVLDEKEAVERMVTALASSEVIANANPIAHIMLGKTNSQIEYSVQATSLSSTVFRELIATGVADCITDRDSGIALTLTSTFVKLKTQDNGDLVFKWNMSIAQKEANDSLYTYSVNVLLKPVEQSVKNIKSEEIIPLYK